MYINLLFHPTGTEFIVGSYTYVTKLFKIHTGLTSNLLTMSLFRQRDIYKSQGKYVFVFILRVGRPKQARGYNLSKSILDTCKPLQSHKEPGSDLRNILLTGPDKYSYLIPCWGFESTNIKQTFKGLILHVNAKYSDMFFLSDLRTFISQSALDYDVLGTFHKVCHFSPRSTQTINCHRFEIHTDSSRYLVMWNSFRISL